LVACRLSTKDQIERASTSIPLNIADVVYDSPQSAGWRAGEDERAEYKYEYEYEYDHDNETRHYFRTAGGDNNHIRPNPGAAAHAARAGGQYRCAAMAVACRWTDLARLQQQHGDTPWHCHRRCPG